MVTDDHFRRASENRSGTARNRARIASQAENASVGKALPDKEKLAEDVGLLKGDEPGEKLFSKVLSRARTEPDRLTKSLAELFLAMNTNKNF